MKKWMTVFVVVGAVALSSAVPAGAQSVAALQDQIATLTAALKACQATPVTIPVTSSSPRHEALAALRAVQRALAGGANGSEFKK
jgi:hypothetical protein